MNFHSAPKDGDLQGQATYGMANLRSERTGLPFVVFISQKDGARHDVRVEVAPGPKARPEQMGSYAARPCRHTDGQRLSQPEEQLLAAWIGANLDVLIGYWNGAIEYTEDALAQLRRI